MNKNDIRLLTCNNLYIFSLTDMDSDGSAFFYPDEMTNESKKCVCIGAIGNEENQQNVDVFTMSNMQN